MLESLFHIDLWFFHFVNGTMSNIVFDHIMPVITDTAYWRPIYAGAIIALLWKGGVKGRWCAATLLVGVAVMDPLSTHLLKEPIGRLRPYDVLDSLNQLVRSGSGSFPSNHALNNAMAATVLTFFYRKKRILWWSGALLVAFTRVYCGVHWPSDIIGGLVIGSAAGWALTHLVRLAWRHTSIPRP